MNYKFDKSKLTDMVSEAKSHKVGLTWEDTFQGQLNESRVPTGKSFDFPKVRAGEKIESKDIIINTKTTKDGVFFIVTNRDTSGMRGSQDKYSMWLADARGKPTHRLGTHSSSDGARKFAKNKGILAEESLKESVKRKSPKPRKGYGYNAKGRNMAFSDYMVGAIDIEELIVIMDGKPVANNDLIKSFTTNKFMVSIQVDQVNQEYGAKVTSAQLVARAKEIAKHKVLMA